MKPVVIFLLKCMVSVHHYCVIILKGLCRDLVEHIVNLLLGGWA